MALTTAADLITLRSHSFILAYQANSQKFIDLGKDVYKMLSLHGGRVPTQADMEEHLAAALLNVTFFQKLCAARRFSLPKFYPAYALALARYTLDKEWGVVIIP